MLAKPRCPRGLVEQELPLLGGRFPNQRWASRDALRCSSICMRKKKKKKDKKKKKKREKKKKY